METKAVDVTPNSPPVSVIAAGPTSGQAPFGLIFDGSGSYDPDGTVLAGYDWDFGDGASGSGPLVTHVYSAAGSFVVGLTVTDPGGLSHSSQIVIEVLPENLRPSAEMSVSTASGVAPLAVEFDATLSTDLDGTIEEYEWDFGDGSTGSGETVTHLFQDPGVFETVLRVVDNEGAEAFASSMLSVELPEPSAPVVELPSSPTNTDTLELRGSAEPGVTVEVQGGAVLASTVTDGAGSFQVLVELRRNARNVLYVTSVDALGFRSSPVPLEVIHDLQPPVLHVDEPASGAVVSTEVVQVAGRVGDLLTGFMGLEVEVESLPANVIVGVGTNGTFDRPGVPLALGTNILTVRAIDQLGNATTRQIIVERRVSSGPRLQVASGDIQSGQTGAWLPEPVRIQLVDGSGLPMAGELVELRIDRSDGLLSPDGTPGTEARHWEVATDGNGEVAMFWRLGSDAGCANNRLHVAHPLAEDVLMVSASAQAAPASHIFLGSGDGQRGESGALAAHPLRVWVSDGRNGVAGVEVSFRTVEGQAALGLGLAAGRNRTAGEITVMTDTAGHAQVEMVLGPDPGLQVIEADFAGNTGLPVTFVLESLERDPALSTQFVGEVIDNAGRPVGGAECSLRLGDSHFETVTDAEGNFSFEGLPSGPGHLHVDGLPAFQVAGIPIPTGSFPALGYEVLLVPNAENRLPEPVRLPPLDPAYARSYDGTEDVELTLSGVDGLRLLVRAGSMRRADGSYPNAEDPAILSLNPVHIDDIPMPMPDGANPPLAWTLQPAGATFDPPVDIVMPNMSGLAPGSAMFFLSFDHATERFEIVASGRVTDDGSRMVTDPGSGITIAGWGGFCPPYPNTGDVEHDPLEEAKDWMDQDLKDKEATAAAALSRQIHCLGQKACGPNGPGSRPAWAQGFVGPLLHDVANNRRNNISIADDACSYVPGWLASIPIVSPLKFSIKDLCFQAGGFTHYFEELIPGFRRHMGNQIRREAKLGSDPEENRRQLAKAKAKVRDQHNAFLLNSIVPCALGNSDLGLSMRLLTPVAVPIAAAAGREVVLHGICERGLLPGSEPGAFVHAKGDFPLPINFPTRDELFSPEVDEVSVLRVTAPGDLFFLPAGGQIQLQVLDELGNDLTAAATGTQYFVAVGDDSVSIGPNGLLTIHRTLDPISGLTPVIYVYVGNDERLGVGQFAIRDTDLDNDLISDSWERAIGLDPSVDDTLTDADGDGLSGAVEALDGLDPFSADTDGDGVDDGVELEQGSEPLDPASTEPTLTGQGTVEVGGRTVEILLDGAFRVRNLPASGELVRVRARTEKNGEVLYGASTFFEIANQQTLVLKTPVSVGPDPIPVTVAIQAHLDDVTLTAEGQATQMRVTAELSDLTQGDVTPRASGTTYVSSNPSVATVDLEGVVIAQSAGVALITARNEGAISTARVTVALGDPLTTVSGQVEDPSGQALALAAVMLWEQQLTTRSGTGGRFEFRGVATTLSPTLTIFASASSPSGLLFGVVAGLMPVPYGTTEVGRLRVQPLSDLADGDGDGAPDALEILLGTDPALADSDDNGIPDGEEDADGDGATDVAELLLGTDPALADSDGDGTLDGEEDSDRDGLTDIDELLLNTDPFRVDTDLDGFGDGEEVELGTDPRDPASTPDLSGPAWAFSTFTVLNHAFTSADLGGASSSFSLFNGSSPNMEIGWSSSTFSLFNGASPDLEIGWSSSAFSLFNGASPDLEIGWSSFNFSLRNIADQPFEGGAFSEDFTFSLFNAVDPGSLTDSVLGPNFSIENLNTNLFMGQIHRPN